ncbi:expressed unknown protein [Seminavis robusta]|uniref:DUF7495 domain-containing protein n=1 Tax=Seminavis robusta TaxID=568900 RepID=A0A9N8HZM7_9STRA|nr:expressed unknown protein [Seminavis robusta]|eukprot:Sro3800_g351160.1 n/a (551) ;mRNA; r:69-1990
MKTYGLLLAVLLGLSSENLTKAEDAVPVATGTGSTEEASGSRTTDHKNMVADAILDPDLEDAEAIHHSHLRFPNLEQGQDIDELEDEQVVEPAKDPLTDEQDIKEDLDMEDLGSAFNIGSATATGTATGTDPKANPNPTIDLGLKKHINPDLRLQVDAHDEISNKTKQDQTHDGNTTHSKNDLRHITLFIPSNTTNHKMPHNAVNPDQIIIMGDASTDLFSHSLPTMQSKEENDPKSPRHDDVKPSVTNYQEQEQDSHIYALSNKTDVESRLEAMKLMASIDKQVNADSAKEDDAEEDTDDEQEDTDAVTVRHGRRLDQTTDWLIGNTRMYGRRETESLPIGWTAAQNFCKAQGGSLASIKEICPPDGTTNRRPLFGIQEGDQWAPISDNLNQDIGAGEDGTIWAIGTHDYGNGCYSIHRNTGGDSWQHIGGCSHRVSVGSSAYVIVLSHAGHIHQWTANGWVFIHSPPARAISITKDGTIWMTELVSGSAHGTVWRKRPGDAIFFVFGGGGGRISGTSNGRAVLCNLGSSLWSHAGSHGIQQEGVMERC